ncbi:hypothetical protein BDP27DRAFT_1367635 [Rhodocollybia butyracea]|uniref:Uncharacterized protein n=1 Tax=Rhodocollybia butyracea TaxID=206335 RepID=A0A9P5PHE9_9AGAR|nr:hypothetical protein BDP27DRAFT_1367635 [Rhodocollybia butyracea]
MMLPWPILGNLVGDFVICWRAWVLLPYDKFWRSALVIIMIGNIGINITDAVFDTFAPNTLLSGSVIVLDWVATAVTMDSSLHHERSINLEKKSRSKDPTSVCGVWSTSTGYTVVHFDWANSILRVARNVLYQFNHCVYGFTMRQLFRQLLKAQLNQIL